MTINSRTLFIVYLFFGLLFPNFYGTFNTKGAIILNALLILMPILYILFKKRLRFPDSSLVHYRLFLLVPFYLLLTIPFSMALGVYFLENNLVIRDFYELHRPVYWFVVFTTSYVYFLTDVSEKQVRRFLITIFIICAALGTLQFFKVGYDFFQLYIKESNYLAQRITAPFPNPYDFGFVMIFFCIYFLSLFNTQKNIGYFLLFLFASILILLTQSRSMLASYILVNIILLPIFSIIYFSRLTSFKLSKTDRNILLLPIIITLLGIWIVVTYADQFKYLINGIYKILKNPVYNGVTDNRIDQLIYIILEITNNPILTLFGNGPAKGEMDDVESIYTYYLFRYGIFGLIIGFLYPAFLGSWCARKMARRFRRGALEYTMFRVFQMWFMIVPLISLGNNHTEQIRVSFLYTVLLGFVAARADSEKVTRCV